MSKNYIFPIQTSSSNGSLELFTGIFYTIQIIGLGQGLIKPSSLSSPNGGYYLEQDIFLPKEEQINSSTFWYFEKSSTPEYYYKWGSYSCPDSRVSWTSTEVEGIYPLTLRSTRELTETIYEDPTSSYWEFESYPLTPLGVPGAGYTIKPLNLFNNGGKGVTFGGKSPFGYWLQINENEVDEQRSKSKVTDRFMADYLFRLTPMGFKLYAEIVLREDSFSPEELDSGGMEKEYMDLNTSPPAIGNPHSKSITQMVRIEGKLPYDLQVTLDDPDIFSGMTIIGPQGTEPGWRYVDLEGQRSDPMELKGFLNVNRSKEMILEAFSPAKNISGFGILLKEFHGRRFSIEGDVSAVVDVMGAHGIVQRNVLVTDSNLLKSLLKSKGYKGTFKDPILGLNENIAKVAINIQGIVRGIFPFPGGITYELKD